MKSIILFAAILILLAGCAAQKQIYKQETQDTFAIPPLPDWIYNTPENFVVGISQKSMEISQMEEAAKQMAAVMESRNQASYTIEKYASTTNENSLSSGVYEFKLNVSSSPQKTNEIYNSMELVDSIEVLGYYFGLFSTTGEDVPDSYKKVSIQRMPQNYGKDNLEISGQTVNCYKTLGSSSLIIAWENAATEARHDIAEYFEKKVQSAIINTDVKIEKRLALETADKLSEMKLKSSYITTELKDNLRLFKVYHQMEISK